MREYLRARHLISRRTIADLQEARRHAEAVTEATPGYAAGWATLAECELLLAHYGAPDQAHLVEACERHVERALALDPGLGIALFTRGAARFFFRCDIEGSAADLGRALQALPSHSLALVSLANVCAVRHDFDAASAWVEQALLLDLDPLSWTPNSVSLEEFTKMAKSKFARRYPPEFRRQLVQLHRAGRTLSDLAREFGCSQWAISRWVRQAARDAGAGDGGLTTDERAELARLRHENKRLKLEREILGKAAAWFAQETALNTRRSSDS